MLNMLADLLCWLALLAMLDGLVGACICWLDWLEIVAGNDCYSASLSWQNMLAAFLLRYDCNLALMAMLAGYAGYCGWLRWFHMLAMFSGYACWVTKLVCWLATVSILAGYAG
jgi:hypothetical protein